MINFDNMFMKTGMNVIPIKYVQIHKKLIHNIIFQNLLIGA